RSACKAEETIHIYPCLDDWTTSTAIEPIYFYQDCWAFEKIATAKPSNHIDIGSHHKYVALLSKVIPITMVDIRPLSLPLDTLRFVEGTILELPFEDSSVLSLSSLCVIEHIGLGRYGDPLDPEGSSKACKELKRVMAPGGSLYLSIPVEAKPATYFNAHRSFSEADFLAYFHEFEMKDSAYIYGSEFVSELRDEFGVGCYHLIKRTGHC
ncbi:MAG: DUF268 domain-containing protein, partial [Cyanobium sp.]